MLSATQASQVEVNKQTGSQMPQLLVLATVFQDLDQRSYQTNWITQVLQITIQI